MAAGMARSHTARPHDMQVCDRRGRVQSRHLPRRRARAALPAAPACGASHMRPHVVRLVRRGPDFALRGQPQHRRPPHARPLSERDACSGGCDSGAAVRPRDAPQRPSRRVAPRWARLIAAAARRRCGCPRARPRLLLLFVCCRASAVCAFRFSSPARPTRSSCHKPETGQARALACTCAAAA